MQRDWDIDNSFQLRVGCKVGLPGVLEEETGCDRSNGRKAGGSIHRGDGWPSYRRLRDRPVGCYLLYVLSRGMDKHLLRCKLQPCGYLPYILAVIGNCNSIEIKK